MTKMTEVIEQEIVAMAEGGVEPLDIAAEVGVSTPQVYTIMRKYNIAVAKPGRKSMYDRLSPEALDDLKESYEEGDESSTSIMERLGIGSYPVFYSILRKMGVAPRRMRLDYMEAKKMQLEHAVEMYVAGHPFWKIKAETGIHQPQLSAEINTRGIPRRRPRRASK